MAVSKIPKDIIIENQTIPVSGFDGTKRETKIICQTKSGYTPYVLHVSNANYNANNHIFYWSDIKSSNGEMYVEHNLQSTVSSFLVTIMFVKN